MAGFMKFDRRRGEKRAPNQREKDNDILITRDMLSELVIQSPRQRTPSMNEREVLDRRQKYLNGKQNQVEVQEPIGTDIPIQIPGYWPIYTKKKKKKEPMFPRIMKTKQCELYPRITSKRTKVILMNFSQPPVVDSDAKKLRDLWKAKIEKKKQRAKREKRLADKRETDNADKRKGRKSKEKGKQASKIVSIVTKLPGAGDDEDEEDKEEFVAKWLDTSFPAFSNEYEYHSRTDIPQRDTLTSSLSLTSQRVSNYANDVMTTKRTPSANHNELPKVPHIWPRRLTKYIT